jgi:hypothetical protein
MKQFSITVAMGKRLIGKALAVHPAVVEALPQATIVIVAGTTNGCVAEEVLSLIGQRNKFSRRRFFRGITLPPDYKTTEAGRLADESGFPGDVVIKEGRWLPGKTINDVAAELKEGDIIIKGANALDLEGRRAAVLIGNSQGGTITTALPAVIGRRVRLIIPIGLEKRISGDLEQIAVKLNSPGASGYRLLPVPGEVITEIEALALLTGASANMFAAGGICGAEGGVWLSIEGTPKQEMEAEQLIRSLSAEAQFVI